MFPSAYFNITTRFVQTKKMNFHHFGNFCNGIIIQIYQFISYLFIHISAVILHCFDSDQKMKRTEQNFIVTHFHLCMSFCESQQLSCLGIRIIRGLLVQLPSPSSQSQRNKQTYHLRLEMQRRPVVIAHVIEFYQALSQHQYHILDFIKSWLI